MMSRIKEWIPYNESAELAEALETWVWTTRFPHQEKLGFSLDADKNC